MRDDSDRSPPLLLFPSLASFSPVVSASVLRKVAWCVALIVLHPEDVVEKVLAACRRTQIGSSWWRRANIYGGVVCGREGLSIRYHHKQFL